MDSHRLGVGDLLADPLEGLHEILAPKKEASIDCWTKLEMRVGDGQDAELLTQGELILDEISFGRLRLRNRLPGSASP